MSKNKRRAKKVKVRKSWSINPRTRVKESGRIYKRPRKRLELKDILKEFL